MQKSMILTFSYVITFLGPVAYMVATSPGRPSHEITYHAEKAVPLTSLKKMGLRPQRGPASIGYGHDHHHAHHQEDKAMGLNVVINAGEVAYLDEDTNIDTLTIEGELHCDSSRAANTIELKAKTIIVRGLFQCGTSSQPYQKKLIISLKHSTADAVNDHEYRGLIVEMGGRLILNGDRKNSGWYKLSGTIHPGDQSLFIDQMPSATHTASARFSGDDTTAYPYLPWRVGDEIVVGPTGYNYLEAEKFTITAISKTWPYEISLDRPVKYTHWGETQEIDSRVLGGIVLDERAEVANLTRSILIRADETDSLIDETTATTAQRGGHIMVHNNGQAYIDSVELYKMGQAGILGRYPFHWHWSGDVTGQYIKNSSVHHSYQRCITVHRTHSALVQNNTCYDFKGHGYFLEDGNEVNNKIIKNLAIMARAPDYNKVLLSSDNISISEGQGRFPSVSSFWISNPKNTVKYNVASGSVGTGLWMSFENEVKDGGGNVVARPISEATTEFSYNTAHTTKVGITWDGAPTAGSANNPNNPNDRRLQSAHYQPPSIPVFTGLVAYKNFLTGIYFRGQTAIFKNNIVADNGWSYWLAYNQIIKDTVLIGKTNNTSAHMDQDYRSKGRPIKTGVVIYDGPFEVNHSDFIDFSTVTESPMAVPFTLTGGTNKFMNVVSGLQFDPEPLHRAYIDDPNANVNARQGLGNAVLRDLDGSLSNTGVNSVVTGTRSLGATPLSRCTDGGETLHNFKICPGNYTEGSTTFMRWGSSSASPWASPFIVRRNDGALNYLMTEWGSVNSYLPNNLFATVNNTNYSYQLLPLYQYETDRAIGATVHMDANSEVANPVSPLIKIVAYGMNCVLGDGAVKVNSVQELLNQTVTSYYSSGKDFYVRLIPSVSWNVITTSPLVKATAKTTMPIRHGITCDQKRVPYEVVGNIESVVRGKTNTTISGWACNFTHQSPIKVQLYFYGPAVSSPDPSRTNLAARIAPPTPNNVYTYITDMTSSQNSDSRVAFNCGKLSSAGRNFSFTFPNETLNKYSQHKVYVKGLSNSQGTDVFLSGSGRFSVVVPQSDSWPHDKNFK